MLARCLSHGRNFLFSYHHPIRTIVLFWGLAILILLGLQLAGMPFGLRIFPRAEDLNWIRFMTEHPGGGVARELWHVDGRNPLSPWWWIAISPLVLALPSGLHLVSLLIHPFLAVVVYLLLEQLTRRQARMFALHAALVTSIWLFNDHYSHIAWNFFGACGITMLSLYFYCRYVDSQRTEAKSFALALLFYFFAFSTYTLQSGAVVGIGFISLLRTQGSWKSRFWHTGSEVAVFLLFFYLFNLIWYTTTPAVPEVFFTWETKHFFHQMARSVLAFVFPPAFEHLYLTTGIFWSTQAIGLTLLVAFLVIFLLLRRVGRQGSDEMQRLPLCWVLVILASLAAPILLTESTSLVWGPGTRSQMVQPAFQPLLYVMFIYLLAGCFPLRLRPTLTTLMVSALCAWIVLFVFSQNYYMYRMSRYQRHFAVELSRHGLLATHQNYLVLMRGEGSEFGAVLNTSNYTQYMYPNIGFIKKMELWPVGLDCSAMGTIFAPDGVYRTGYLDDKVAIPYEQIKIVSFDGRHITVPETIDKADLGHECVHWTRKTPIHQR